MPIVVRQPPEPLTYGSHKEPPKLAKSAAYRTLLHDILRYGRRQTMGRSVLISGHRGSGKTTLVRWAIQQAQAALESDPLAARPLLVPLHGPDLLGGAAVLAVQPSEEPAKAAGTAASGKTPIDGDQADTLAALRMLTETLHRAFVNELGRSFAERASKSASLHEVVAQLHVELDHAPELDTLRFLWHKAGRLEAGVLFPADLQRTTNQGFRELVAASAAIDAYRRVAGKLEGVDGSSHKAELSHSLRRKQDWSGKDLLNPLAGIIAGTLAGGGILAGGTGGARPVLAALASLIIGVGGAAALNYSSTRKQKSTRESNRSFQWDTSIASLDRLLPALVERIVEAGLAPIFVVDELDKIPHIEQKMEKLIQHLKHLVTEKTFFCFLADRSYFEHVMASSRAEAYGREHTFFSGRLFVQYRPADLHEYLRDILDADKANDNEKLDVQVLPFLLLYRAKMHPIDLRRAISDLTDDQSQITLTPGAVRSVPGYILAVFIQAAVEMVLEGEDLRDRLRLDPNFARHAYDALYAPSRSWEGGQPQFDWSRDALRGKLQERMRAEDDSEDHSKEIDLNEPDLDLLHGAVTKLVSYLKNPQTLTSDLQFLRSTSAGAAAAMFKDVRWDTIPDMVPKAALLGVGSGETAPWQSDEFGRVRAPVQAKAAVADAGVVIASVPAPPGAEIPATPEPPVPIAITDEMQSDLRTSFQSIQSLDKLIRDLTGARLNLDKLASQTRLLGTSPAWPAVEKAIHTLQNAGTGADPALANAGAVVTSYFDMLREAIPAIRRALVLAVVLSLEISGKNRPRRVERALNLLASELRFAKLSTEELLRVLAEYDEPVHIMANPPLSPIQFDIYAQTPDTNFESWIAHFRKWLAVHPERSTGVSASMLQSHQQRWLDFLIHRFRTGDPVFIPTLEDLVLKASGMALPMNPELSEMTYGEYANVLLAINSDESSLPLLREAVLVELGFARQVKENLLKSDPAPAGSSELYEACDSNPALQRDGERVLLFMSGVQEEKKELDDDSVVVVSKGTGSLAKDWRVSQKHAVYPVFAVDEHHAMGTFSGVPITLILIEENSPALNWSWFSSALRWKFRSPTKLAPADLDAAVEEAKRHQEAVNALRPR